MRCSLVVLVALCAGLGARAEEAYHEALSVRPLTRDAVLSSFDFRWSGASPSAHVRLLPKELSLVLGHHQVAELHLSFTQGRWRFQRWGRAERHAPPGVDMWAAFSAANSRPVDERWAELTQSLGGLFCATLQFLPQGNSWAPSRVFPHSGVHYDPSWARRGSLPREAVCTENLTPFVKLLPCRDAAGLGRLLNPLKLYDVAYHSMQVHFYPTAEGDWELLLSLDVVTQSAALRTAPWKLSELFGRDSADACPPADSSRLVIAGEEVPLPYHGSVPHEGRPGPAHWVQSSRFIEGYGQERGAVTLELYNPSQREALRLFVTEMVPSEFKVYLHTLRPRLERESMRLVPGGNPPKGQPTVIEMHLTLAANESVRVHYEFEKNFLHWTAYPPDAHRGYDIPSSILVNLDSRQTVYTESLLALFPTPDFSMPFNVITLSGTLVGFFFGTVLGLLNQDFSPLKDGEQIRSNRPIARLARLVMRLVDGE